MRHSESALGGNYRQIARRARAHIVVCATARTLAALIGRLLRCGQPNVAEGAAAYDQSYRDARIRRRTDSANDWGDTLVAKAA